MVALRLPVARVRALMNDPDPQGAHRARASGSQATTLAAHVRRRGLLRPARRRRAAPSRALLVRLIDDPDRRCGARPRGARPTTCSPRMTGDPDPLVRHRGRRAAAGRALHLLAQRRGLARALRLRRTAAERAVGALADDDDEVVREAALARKTSGER